MQEIAALVSGIAGAESGHAEIYLRGTSIRATYYSDFEGTTSIATGADVTLDANGAAVVYVNAVVSVRALSSAGEVVRTFTAGVESTAVTYAGPSFTGRDYETGASAVSEPTTVKSALDKWYDSAAAADFKVNAFGSSQTLYRAINGIGGVAYNVKDPAYGAVGNGIANDSAAIALAIAAALAAGGGTVLFPAGTYLCTGLTIGAGVSLAAAGPQSVTLASSGTGTMMTFAISATKTQRIAGINFGGGSQTLASSQFVLETGSRPFFDNCRFAQASSTSVITQTGAPTVAKLRNCDFVFSSSLSGGATLVNVGGAATGGANVVGCSFVMPASVGAGTYNVINVDFTQITACAFDNTALATGGATVNCVRASATTAVGNVSGCVFTNGAGATIVGILLGTYASTMSVAEGGNAFGSTVTAYSYTAALAAAGAVVSLQSREHRTQRITSNATAITIASDLFGVVYINRSGTAALTISGPIAPEGARLTIVVENKGGGVSGTVVLSSTWFEAGGAGATIANNNFSIYRCRAVTLAANPLWAVESLRENVT